MEVILTQAADESGRIVADAIGRLLDSKPEAILGLATGSSPGFVYQELGARVTRGELSLRRASAFLLDEYVGLPEEHPQRYRNVIRREFVDLVDIDDSAVHGPDGCDPDPQSAASEYELMLRRAGGVDLQILGIGSDGHIAFNEPSSSLASRTRMKTLSRRTLEDNARFFGGDPGSVPTHCLTQGLANILDARHVVLVAAGEAKAEAVRQMVEGPVSARWPASVLQLHRHATVVLDPSAASRLELADYYRSVALNKPQWQQL